MKSLNQEEGRGWRGEGGGGHLAGQRDGLTSQGHGDVLLKHFLQHGLSIQDTCTFRVFETAYHP